MEEVGVAFDPDCIDRWYVSLLYVQVPTIYELASHEMNFALRVEEFLGSITFPEYRQVVVEVHTWSSVFSTEYPCRVYSFIYIRTICISNTPLGDKHVCRSMESVYTSTTHY